MLGRVAFGLVYLLRRLLARRFNRRHFCVLKYGMVLHPLYFFHLAAPSLIVLPLLLLRLNLSLPLTLLLFQRILFISHLFVVEHLTLVYLFKLSLLGFESRFLAETYHGLEPTSFVLDIILISLFLYFTQLASHHIVNTNLHREAVKYLALKLSDFRSKI